MHLFNKHWLTGFFVLDLMLTAVIAGSYYDDHLVRTGRPSMIKAITTFFSSTESDLQQTGEKVVRVADRSKENATHALIQAPQISQNPELPRGCEVTALAMMLEQAGVKTNKMELAEKLKKVPYKQKGYYGNPEEGFVGSMYQMNSPGYGVYHQPLADLAQKFLPFRIEDLTGKPFSAVSDSVNDGRPVVVIINVTFKPLPDSAFETWHTDSGSVRITHLEHAVLIIGFDRNTVYFNDPLGSKNEHADRQDFIQAWKQMGGQAITYTRFPIL